MFKETKKFRKRPNFTNLHILLLFIAISFIAVDIAAAGQGKSATAQRRAKRNFRRSSNTSQSFAAPTGASAVNKSDPIRRRRPGKTNQKQSRSFRRKFSEVEIVLSDDFTLADASSLPAAPGSNLTVLNDPMRVGMQLPISEIKTLIEEGIEVTMLRNFVLVGGFADETNAMANKITTAASSSSAYEYDYNSQNYSIPSSPNWNGSPISISGSPGGQTVTSVDVHYEIEPSWTGYVYAELSDGVWDFVHPLVDYVDWSIDETRTGITTFNGRAVNQRWVLWAQEVYSFGDGYIDYWWIKVYYGPPLSDIHGYKFDDADGDGVWDQSEVGLAGWTIYLDTNTNGQYDAQEPSVITDPNGHYEFLGLDPDTYTVAEVMQTGWTQTFPGENGKYLIIAEPNQVYSGKNFGNTTGTPLKYGGGTGTLNDPYLIFTAEQMNQIGLNQGDWGKHFKLMADIDLGHYDGLNNRPKFNCIGTGDSHGHIGFTGTFDGNEKTISNFTYSTYKPYNVAIFAYMDDGEIRDLIIETPLINYPGGGACGALVGSAVGGVIRNCHVIGGSISWNDSVGALVGDNQTDIYNCSATTSVTGGDRVGGLTGRTLGRIYESFATGNVSGNASVGGMTGRNLDAFDTYGIIENCYATGNVNGMHAGGLVGLQWGGKVVDSYSTGKVSGDSNIGGLIGSVTVGGYSENSFWDMTTSLISISASGTGLPTEQMQSIDTFLNAGWDFAGESQNGTDDIWKMSAVGYPLLAWQIPVTISGYVKTSEEYNLKDVTITASTGETTTTDNDGYYELTVSTPGPIPVPWQGTITAAKDYWSFQPAPHSLADLTADTPDVDFTGTYTEDSNPTISGYVRISSGEGVEGVLMYADAYGGSTVTNENGYYELTVLDFVLRIPRPWTGNVTPCKTDWSFDTVDISYTDLHADISGQDYVGTYIGAGCGGGWIEEWVARYHGSELEIYMDSAQDIAVDDLGNIYVTGSSYNRPDPGTSGNSDYATIKYDSNGNQLWVTKYNGPANRHDGGGGFVDSMFMAVDSSGNVYVTGYSWSQDAGTDYATVKYDTNGNELWVARYNGPGDYNDEPSGLAIDNAGNVYVTGNSGGNDGYHDYATIKYDSNGVELWVARYDGNGDEQDWVNAIAVDGLGNVYVTGHSDPQDNDIYDGQSTTIKYDPDGVELWVEMYDDPENLSSGAFDIAIDDMGNIYITGGSEDSENNNDFLTIKYDLDGVQDWASQWNGPDNSYEFAKKIVLDGFGNVYVSGDSTISGTDADFMTIKYDSDSGQLLWAARQNGSEDLLDNINDMAVDDYGNVYVTGISDYLRQPIPNPPIGNYMTVKYTPNSSVPAWIAKYEGTPGSLEIAAAIVVDNSNNVYVTGSGAAYTTIKYSQCPLSVDLGVDRTWMYQNLPGKVASNLTATVAIIDDPSSNNSYSYQWEIILPSDVTIEPSTVSGGDSGDESWTFAAPSCNEPTGISDSGQMFTVKVTVTGDDFGNVGSAQMDFAIALLGDINNDRVVNGADRGITNTFWRNGVAGPFTLRDCDLNCDGVVNGADRGITNTIWRSLLGSNSVTVPCPVR